MRQAKWAAIFWLGAGLAAAAQTPEPTPSSPAAETSKPALTPSKPGAKTYFIDLKDGATIAPTTTIHFGLTGMGVAPAGVSKPNSGHFHLLIDAEQPALDAPIPNDENHLHFGAGQTETTVTLTPGKHTLQLLMGDANHVPHSPPVMSALLHVTVAEPAAPAAPAAAAAASPDRHPSPKNARVYFESPSNGAYVPTTFTVHFGLTGMGVAPAGFDKPNTGHHHIVVDASLPPFDQPIPSDENHLHFGAGADRGERHLAQRAAHSAIVAGRRPARAPRSPDLLAADRRIRRHVAAAPGARPPQTAAVLLHVLISRPWTSPTPLRDRRRRRAGRVRDRGRAGRRPRAFA